jgi:phosphomannomutase
MHTFHPSILREYDIRGVFEKTLFPKDAYYIGRCYGAELTGLNPTVAVCWDGRLSSPTLVASLVEGLIDAGVHVKKVGCGPTPMLYFSVAHLKLDGGIMVTGSHNPKDHNGFKMILSSGPVMSEDIQAFQDIVKTLSEPIDHGSIEDVEIQKDYISRLVQDLSMKADLKVVWDTGNGACGDAVRDLIGQLPGTHKLLYGTIDGTFPNHHPDPSHEDNLEDLKQAVLQEEADLGFAFDGDGDRLGVVNEKGCVFPIDQMLILLARDVVQKNPGKPIIADIKTSQSFFDDIKERGGEPVIWKTGHSHIKKKMKAIGAPFAGEITGHIFFADQYYGFDDALYTAVRLLSLVGSVSLSELQTALPSYFTGLEVRMPCDDEHKFSIVETIIAQAKLDPDVNKMIDIDGLRVEYPGGWWLVRASNTQDRIVFRAEGKTKEDYENIIKKAFIAFKAAGINLKDYF